ncbi:glutamyl-tRNA reductase [Gorillibacterium timonense]|uniref:glutamyl-tRNA reductase n=1 Tax=Gorillibacterium timonense TaxID=1689269 RepID=UPI00071E46B0|nr:glutamyl-tRNA reductase [Gorillibacterium timonense]
MHILAVGLHYRTAPVELREKFALSASDLPEALRELKETTSVLECVIVSTCNRTELFLVVDRKKMCGNYIRSYLEQRFGVSREEFNPHLFFLEEEEAVKHLFRVACGLDSMVIGETQILGQVRNAFLCAQAEKTTGTLFNMLFKQAVTLAKRARTETSIADNPVSVSYAAVELGRRFFGSFAGKRVLIIGAGKMGELTAKHLHSGGAAELVVMNRTYEKAEELALRFGGQAVPFALLSEELAAADIVISSTGSSETVLAKRDVEAILPGRAGRPLFLIDIAVPRDLDPQIAELPGVHLSNIDDLESIVESNLEERRKAASRIEEIIEEEHGLFAHWLKTLGVGPVIHALQEKSSRIHEDTMDSLMKKLPHLSDRDKTVIHRLTKSIVNQMLRDPIIRVKELAGEDNGSEAVEQFVKLFALEEWVKGAAEPEHATQPEPELALEVSRNEPEPLASRMVTA